MKKIIGFIVILLMIPFVILVIGDIDKKPIYPTTEFNIEKLTRISSLDMENNDIELLKLPNGVGDKWLQDGSIERNVGKYIVQDFSSVTTAYVSNNVYRITLKDFVINDIINMISINSNSIVSNSLSLFTYSSWNSYPYRFGLLENDLYISLPVDYIDTNYSETYYTDRIRSYLNDFPITIYYQLATPIIVNTTTLPEFIDFYDGGSVIVDDGIVDYTVIENQAKINYIEGDITTFEDGNFKISKPTKIISKSNDLFDYDLSTLPNYIEYGTLQQGTYDNILEFINDNQNIKLFYNDIIQEGEYNIYLENDIIIVSNDSEFIRIYNNDTYTSTRNLDTNINYKIEGYDIIDYTEGGFDDAILGLFWVIPVLLAGLLIYLIFKRKE